MPPRSSRRSGAATRAPPTDEGSDNEISDAEAEAEAEVVATDGAGLKFNESLLGRPGRPIPVGQLLKRLQKLSEELMSLDQDVSEEFKETCRPVAKELGDQSVLQHKDKGVRAWAAQCIVDVLSLCAPDAPFTSQQLKAIFDMFIKTIFPALADPSNAYNLQHIYVLESLANIKSILLITDLPNASKLMIQMFTTFFDIFMGTAKGGDGGEPISKHVEYTMLTALVTVVDEAESLPQEVVDIVISQFIRANPKSFTQKDQKSKKGEKVDEKQTTLARQELPTAYLMAKDICNMVPEKMAREVSKYFSEVIMEASGIGGDGKRRKGSGDPEDAEEGDMGLSEEDLEDLSKAHKLVRELWRACPSVVQNVIPQLEAELAAENVQLRVLATETLGDLISGIGAAGPPPSPKQDAAAYPPLSFANPPEPPVFDPLTTPKAPQPFSQVHHQAYQSFLGRRQDKSVAVRTAWTTAIGHILATDAGGVGLGSADEKRLVEDLARMFNDVDEKVRLAAVDAVSFFSCQDALSKLGSVGGVDTEGSVLANLAAHTRDRKSAVKAESMTVLARLWGVAYGEIADGNEQVVSVIGGAPSHLLNTYYANSPESFECLDKALFEELLPLNYPPIKSKGKDKTNGSSQRTKDGQTAEVVDLDADAIRAERILVLVHNLDERAKKIFYGICDRQTKIAKYVQAYLQACEAYNGGVMDKNEDEIKSTLTNLIKAMSGFYPDPAKVSTDLWKFANIHDRRNYQLIKFCLDAKSDYKTVRQAIRELNKRVTESNNPSLSETLTAFMYRSGLMLYNRSHVPAVLQFSKTNERGMSSTAHEVLRDMSSRNPEVLETHIREMCQSLQDDVPSANKTNSPGAIDSLKACAAFARRFPQKLPKDKKFFQAISSYTAFGSPPAAGKHAVSIIMAASDRKETAAKDIVQKCLKGLKYGDPSFVTRLASLSQVVLLAPKETESSAEAIFDIASKEVLAKRRAPDTNSDYVWEVLSDDEGFAKIWAIRILTNQIRSITEESALVQAAQPVYNILNALVANMGELSSAEETPAGHKPQLRLTAAISLLKLSRTQRHDSLLDPIAFQKLSEVAQDKLHEVRSRFVLRLRKYLTRNSLSSRFYVIPFLLAFDPTPEFKTEMTTWLKHRTQYFATQANNAQANGKGVATKSKAPTTMEGVMPRLISLLVRHEDCDTTEGGLRDMAEYIIFYLRCAATAQNVSLIYHLAQRVKGHHDTVLRASTTASLESFKKEQASVDSDTRLHTLSDLASAIVRSFAEAHDWNLQTLPGRVKLPLSLMQEIRDDDLAIKVAGKDFIGDSLRESLDKLVHDSLRRKSKKDKRKRKSGAAGVNDQEDAGDKAAKRAKHSSKSGKPRRSKSAKKRRGDDWSGDDEDEAGERRKRRDLAADKDRRKSGRSGNAIKYRERDDDEDDKEMLGGVAEWEYENGQRWREAASSSSEEQESESGESHGENVEAEEADSDNDVQMEEAGGEEDGKGEGEDVENTTPPAAKGRRAGRAGPKARATAGAIAKADVTPKANARSSGRAAKTSPAAGKDDQKMLPTRSGRATRSAAA